MTTVTLEVVSADGAVKAAVSAEIADTPELRRRGLSGRTYLPAGCGMFFDKVGAYWMKGVKFPLDIVFVDGGGRILEIQKMATVADDDPHKPLYVASDPAAEYALEVPRDWCDGHGIVPGDILKVASESGV